jgi:hypothetical protein
LLELLGELDARDRWVSVRRRRARVAEVAEITACRGERVEDLRATAQGPFARLSSRLGAAD